MSPPMIACGYRLIGGGVVRLGGIDLDATLELRAVLDANTRGGDVPDARAIALDVNAAAGANVTDCLPVDGNRARVNLRSELRRGSDGQLVATQGNRAVDFSIDLQIFRAGDVTLDLQAGTEARGAASGAASERRNRSRGVAEGDDRGFCCLGRY